MTELVAGVMPADLDDEGWISRLRQGEGPHAEAVEMLHRTVARAARYQVRRMTEVWDELGSTRAEEIIESAADEATMDVLAHLDQFERRSRFTTWVYKFGIRHAAAEARRALWRGRPLNLDDQAELASADAVTPESYAEARDLSTAVSIALQTALTPHQRRVARALIVDEVPIDVLAERLGTNRNALYKTLHDARVRLRIELCERGFLAASPGKR